jgi:hypothetical protein
MLSAEEIDLLNVQFSVLPYGTLNPPMIWCSCWGEFSSTFCQEIVVVYHTVNLFLQFLINLRGRMKDKKQHDLFIYLFIYLCFKIFEYNSLTSNCCILKNMTICIKNLSSVQVLSTPPRQYWCLLRNHGFWYCGCISCLL